MEMENQINRKRLFAKIKDGLQQNPQNYELYCRLGDYYVEENPSQALLCYSQAEFYCRNEAGLPPILKAKKQLQEKGMALPGVSVIILSYNAAAEIKVCLESLKDSVPESYEIIVIDNGSDDGTAEYLKVQNGIKLICNDVNIGYPAGYNRGIQAANAQNDIMLLHNDAIVMPNSLFWLRMGLYEAENVAGTGSISNFAQNYQQIGEVYESPEDYLKYGILHNIPMERPYERKLRLTGLALMLKREILEKIGMFDECFSPGNCEEDDLCYRMIDAGYQLLLCRNSFVYHFGTESLLKKMGDASHLMEISAEKFKKKWGFDFRYYTYERRNLTELMKADTTADIKILEVGCGMGATLGYLQSRYPNAEVYGIELIEDVAVLARKYLPNIICGNIEQMELPYHTEYFDYIIFADVLEHLHDPEKILKKVKNYVKPNGFILASIPNVMHYSVMLDLLKGNFTYRDSGILDRTHLHFFTYNEIMRMFARCGCKVEEISGSTQDTAMTEDTKELYEKLLMLPGIAPEYNFHTYQYLVRAQYLFS